MRIQRCPSPACNRLFQVNQFTSSLLSLADKGRILCPHCGSVSNGDNASVFLTHALSTQEEAQLNVQSRPAA